MPIAAAVIPAALSVGGALIAGGQQKKAINRAAGQAERAAEMNNALQRDIYSQNLSNLSPFMSRGNAAGNAINALLGIGVPANTNTAPQTLPAMNTLAQFANRGGTGDGGARQFSQDLHIPAQVSARMFARGNGGRGPMYGAGSTPASVGPVAGGAAPATAADPLGAYRQAFNNYRNSTGYQFRVNEGQDAINHGYAARGQLESGAALKALEQYRQGIASDEFNRYLSQLGQQQDVGLSGANALAGVGTDYARDVSANNNSAASAAANAALAKGQVGVNTLGSIFQGLGNVAGSFGGFGSSFGQANSGLGGIY